MSTEYWKLPEVIFNELEPLQSTLAVLVGNKVNDLQYHRSKPVSQRQHEYLRKDELLLEKYNEYIQLLTLKIDFLLREHKTLNVMLSAEVEKNQPLQTKLFELQERYNLIRTQYEKF